MEREKKDERKREEKRREEKSAAFPNSIDTWYFSVLKQLKRGSEAWGRPNYIID